MDNGTMVESFKFLNYCQLAHNSLVSKRFRNVIRTHRHQLPLFYVNSIFMRRQIDVPAYIKISNEELSPEAYNEWIVRNGYSKQVPLEGQVAGMQITQNASKFYELWADANYKDSKHFYETRSVSYAKIELNDENWPVFQHFARLLTDPFIYIRDLELISQNDFLNLLTSALDTDLNRLQCESLKFILKDNSQNFVKWIKNHARCDKFRVLTIARCLINCDEEFLDFFMTGANCTLEVEIKYIDISQHIFDFVQKFMDLKSCDETQMVESIRGNSCKGKRLVKALKRKFADVIVKEEHYNRRTVYVLELINNCIGKKLQLVIITVIAGYQYPGFSLEIANL